MHVQPIQQNTHQQSFGKLTKVKFVGNFPKPDKNISSLMLMKTFNESKPFQKLCKKYDDVKLHLFMTKEYKGNNVLMSKPMYRASAAITYGNEPQGCRAKLVKALGLDVFSKYSRTKEISSNCAVALYDDPIQFLTQKVKNEKFDFEPPQKGRPSLLKRQWEKIYAELKGEKEREV